MKLIISLKIAFLLFTISCTDIIASCILIPVNKEYEKSSHIFTGIVTEAPGDFLEEEAGYIYINSAAHYKYRVKVKEYFKGTGGIDIYVYVPIDMNSIHLKKEVEYLIYATGKDLLIIRPCSRTKPIDKSLVDIEFLRNVKKYSGKTVLAGEIKFIDRINQLKQVSPPPDKISIILYNDDTSYSTISREDGLFIFENIKPGSYKLQIYDNKYGIHYYGSRYLAQLEAKLNGHKYFGYFASDSEFLQVEVLVTHSNFIEGKITDENGKDLEAEVIVDLLPVESFRKDYSESGMYRNFTLTEKGKYKFANIPPGEYYLGLFLKSHNKETIPLYYPGTEKIGDAYIIKIEPHSEYSGADIRFSRKLNECYVKGRVTDQNDKPLKNIRVDLVNLIPPVTFYNYTNENGYYIIKTYYPDKRYSLEIKRSGIPNELKDFIIELPGITIYNLKDIYTFNLKVEMSSP